jgi:hypothetical protein
MGGSRNLRLERTSRHRHILRLMSEKAGKTSKVPANDHPALSAALTTTHVRCLRLSLAVGLNPIGAGD